jgi:cytochrome c biogenesis protein CcdA
MDLIFAYLAGLLTLLNPCVLPVLPIVLATSLQSDRRAPVALALGMSVSFVVLGLGVASLGPAMGITEGTVSRLAALLMIGFGMVMLVPALGGRFALAASGIAAKADAGMTATTSGGLASQAMGGILLGAVWSPCIGPTLGAAIAMASQGEKLARAGAVMGAFALGVSSLMLLIAYGARQWVRRNMVRMRAFAERSKPALGIAFVLIGLGLLFQVNHAIDAWMIENLPVWLVDFSVSI